jgi:cytochrome c oxidase subunit 2
VRWFWLTFFTVFPIAAIVFCAMAPGMNWWFPSESGSPLGLQIDSLFYLILYIVTATFIGTQIATIYVLWKSSKPTDEKGWFSHGSHNLEVIWTIVPAGILLFIALYQMNVWAEYRVVSEFPEQARNAPVAEVMARQFEWRIRYPQPGRILQIQPEENDIYAVNELIVPAGRPVMIYLKTQDVQHSFFVPDLRVKQDAVPGQIIPVWFEVTKPGEYALVCAELCGWGHYKMKARVVALPESGFEAAMEKLETEQSDDGFSDESADDE